MQRQNNDFSITTGRDGSRTFGDHDDRWMGRGRGNRWKHNKNYGGRGSSRGRGRGRDSNQYYSGSGGASYFDQEGDVMMGGDAEHGVARRYNPYSSDRPMSRHGRRNQYQGKNNRPSQQPHDGSRARRLGLPLQSQGRSWSKVSVSGAKKIEKQTLLDLLGKQVPGNFRPIQFTYNSETAVFFLNDRDVADFLRNLRYLPVPNSDLKLKVHVRASSPPFTVMNDENKAKLTTAMSARYDPSIKVLDLTAFHDEQSLIQEGLFVPLNRTVVISSVAAIIAKNIPELVGLNLSKNRLLSLSLLQDMTSKATNVTSLNLGHNQLNRIDELDKIKQWKLVELVLDGNPLCDKFSSKADYISAVRKRFPKVVKLDGNDLPPPITFDVSTSVVPASKGSYFVNSEVQDLVVRFLKEYYTIYDSDSRQPLVDAYHEMAVFSLTMATNPSIEKQPTLADYVSESRNALRIRGDDRSKARTMEKLLKHGRLQVVSSLSSLPKTTHDANSFVVDVSLVSSTLLSFVVSGLFKETDNKADKPPIRAFSRCFIAVPANGGVLISNDMLTITNATPEQQQAAFKSTGPTPSSSPVSSNPPALTSPVPSTSGATSPVGPVLSPQQQLESLPLVRQQMVVSFSEQSGMNYIFSFRCLEDNGWDYEKSAQTFMNLKTEGKIPPDAFVK
ncbi:nuclear RNA export factor 1-like isoform X2 [Babylonia areolata]|uniref:nuclear RNA export factor 1-like isoform X2 n=1 Tax=Babylonia areolata TaxID=304850 RepID=UPI003FD4B14E